MTPKADADDSRPPLAVAWRIRDAVFAILLTHLVSIAIAVASVIALGILVAMEAGPAVTAERVMNRLHEIMLGPFWSMGMLLVTYGTMAGFTWLFLLRRGRMRLGALFAPGQEALDARIALRLLFVCVFATTAFVACMMAVLAVLGAFFTEHPGQMVDAYLGGLEEEGKILEPLAQQWSSIVMMVLIGPPVEEVLYRGGLYGALRQRFRPWVANVISSGVFAFSHPYVFGRPHVLIAGILCAYAYERTRSLRAPIIFHILWNLLVASSMKPVLWIPLGVIVLGAAVWLQRTSGGLLRERLRWWRVYAVVSLIMLAVSYAGTPDLFWHAGVEFPAYVALVAYAWRRPRLSRPFWRAYGVLLVLWLLVTWLAFTTPLEARASWHLALVGSHAIELGTTEEMIGTLLVNAFFFIPQIVAIWRLSTGSEGARHIRVHSPQTTVHS